MRTHHKTFYTVSQWLFYIYFIGIGRLHYTDTFVKFDPDINFRADFKYVHGINIAFVE